MLPRVGVVFVVGSVNADVALPVAQLPVAGSTILAGPPVRSGGGKGANASVAAARDGVEERLVAAVGADAEGERSAAELEADGVGTTSVAVLAEHATGLAMICVDADGENFVVVAPGANAALSAGLVREGLRDLRGGDVCVVNFEIPPEAVAAAAAVCRERGARLLVNASPVRPLPDALLAAAPILVINRGELAQLAGIAEVVAAAEALLERGCEALVVTLGAAGAHVFADGRDEAVAPYPARPVDTTGAGDTFTGVLAGALAAGESLAPAARRAAAAGALSTEGMGARTAMPDRGAIDRLLRA
ncbi:MAG: Ribokinase [uncultured Solirubrobacteraceae bacterium]|uniref:Ribokinase n=1 Tax=uncultured Solirubrobacteraceae bacterium TaxID=1162706 RepID=A0A6J4RFF9_9ACTN|nr:MAG: Ribokinase [uncultured Solirubrobacteraceae bacterium]